jgi:hypothetical protein
LSPAQSKQSALSQLCPRHCESQVSQQMLTADAGALGMSSTRPADLHPRRSPTPGLKRHQLHTRTCLLALPPTSARRTSMSGQERSRATKHRSLPFSSVKEKLVWVYLGVEGAAHQCEHAGCAMQLVLVCSS